MRSDMGERKGRKVSLAGIYTDAEASAKLAGLRYVTNTVAGITRTKKKDRFEYLDRNGAVIKDTETLVRIKSLSIPPAWENVWISPYENSHLQATGIDSKGRKQYRYHPEWSKIRGLSKFDRMLKFGEKLPLIRSQVAEHLQLRGMPRQRVLAVIVDLLDKTFLRIGNQAYEKTNKTYGLTTLQNRHVKISKDEIQFRFRAKSGKESDISIQNPLLAKIVKRCREIPGYHLFSYIDEAGIPHDISSQDVNTYLKELSGEDFTAKDFRTWGGTLSALEALQDNPEVQEEAGLKKVILGCVRIVAERLKNTVNVCRKYYIHPRIFEAYMQGELHRLLSSVKPVRAAVAGYSPGELVVLELLRKTS
jgi:DNA topoisomerase I